MLPRKDVFIYLQNHHAHSQVEKYYNVYPCLNTYNLLNYNDKSDLGMDDERCHLFYEEFTSKPGCYCSSCKVMVTFILCYNEIRDTGVQFLLLTAYKHFNILDKQCSLYTSLITFIKLFSFHNFHSQ